MSNSKNAITYWRRRKPSREYDIARLRPASLPRGERFETTKDAGAESLRSETVLKDAGAPQSLWQYLAECGTEGYVCERTYCPNCARTFRRWLIGEILQIVEAESAPAHVITVLLARAADIRDLNPKPFRHSLRKRLDRAGLGNTIVIGGFEMVWRARQKDWVLHANLLILEARHAAIARFEDSFDSSDLARPTQKVALKDLAKQVSYLLKFTTYHRPHRQSGKRKPEARPLNAKEHLALVKWMSRYEFADMLFLCRVRRHGSRLTMAAPAARD
jgi:hypothetical protein